MTTATTVATPFGELLRAWRRHRGLSQLALAGESGTSPRHLSFLETGRARPSTEMVRRLARSLDVPPREENQLLLSAGFAPVHTEHAVTAGEMDRILWVVERVLQRHEPYPAYAIDGAWNIVSSNRANTALFARILGFGWPGDRATNLLELLCAPGLLRPAIRNWRETTSVVLQRVRRQLSTPAPNAELSRVYDEVLAHPGIRELEEATPIDARSGPFLPVVLELEGRSISWLTTLLGIGGALDVTADELVVECFFPADDASEESYRALALDS